LRPAVAAGARRERRAALDSGAPADSRARSAASKVGLGVILKAGRPWLLASWSWPGGVRGGWGARGRQGGGGQKLEWDVSGVSEGGNVCAWVERGWVVVNGWAGEGLGSRGAAPRG
jgi:hypothetical protein